MSQSSSRVLVTTKAAQKLKELNDSDSEPILHLYAAGRTCCGVRYGLQFTEDIVDGYDVSECDGVRLVIDPESLPYCDGASIDYVQTADGDGFTVSNPAHAGGACGCGGS